MAKSLEITPVDEKEDKYMKAYYLSKIFLDMTVPTFPAGVWRHKLQTYPGIDYASGEIKTDPTTGIPTEKVLLVLAGGINHAQLRSDPDIVPLPVVPLDIKVSSIQTETKITAKTAIAALGFSEAEVMDVWGNADGLRDIVNHYGRLNNSDFDASNFDVDES